MIGKTLYKAKVIGNKVVMTETKIDEEKRKYYYYKGKMCCLKSDVGVVIFLTQKEALNYRISELKHSVKMGEDYLKKTRQALVETKNYKIPE